MTFRKRLARILRLIAWRLDPSGRKPGVKAKPKAAKLPLLDSEVDA